MRGTLKIAIIIKLMSNIRNEIITIITLPLQIRRLVDALPCRWTFGPTPFKGSCAVVAHPDQCAWLSDKYADSSALYCSEGFETKLAKVSKTACVDTNACHMKTRS